MLQQYYDYCCYHATNTGVNGIGGNGGNGGNGANIIDGSQGIDPGFLSDIIEGTPTSF